jgi:hypothetical protein
MLEEDAQDEELSGKPYRFAKKFPINISPNTDKGKRIKIMISILRCFWIGILDFRLKVLEKR